MKSSSGRAPSAATLATAALGALCTTCCALALCALPATSAWAQKTNTVPHGPPVRDLTPDADASIQQKNWTAALAQLDARIAANPRDAQAKFKRAVVDRDAFQAKTKQDYVPHPPSSIKAE